MKKSVTINIMGTLFTIDEDAYELLKRYLDDIKRYFANRKGGEEIANDIEYRVGELMQELKEQQAEPVTIEHIKNIIERIGNPQDVDDTDDEQRFEQISEKPDNGKKKLFRNPNDKMLGGVLSGLACYLGIDTVWLRLATVVVSIFTFQIPFLSCLTILFAYLILWFIIPLPSTPDERLQMQGRSINMENLSDEIVNGPHRAAENKSKQPQSILSRILNSLFQLLAILVKGVGIFFIGVLCLFFGGILILLLIIFGALLFGLSTGIFETFSPGISHLLNNMVEGEIYWVGLISLLVSLVMFVYLLVHAIMRMFRKGKAMKRITLTTCVVTLLVSTVIFISSGVSGMAEFRQIEREFEKSQKEQRDSIAISQQQTWLEERGWTVVNHEHCGDRYTSHGEYFTGDRGVYYIDAWSHHPNMHYTVERTVHVAPGTYTLKAAVRTDGEGPEIYVYTGNVCYTASIPNYGNKGGVLYTEACEHLASDKNLENRSELEKITRANQKRGYGWSIATIENIVVRDSVLRYGVSNRSLHTNEWNGKWFSATDFKLNRVK